MSAHHIPAHQHFLFPLQVRKAGEAVMVAGVAVAVGLGVFALAGALFGGNKKEKRNTQ